MEPKPQMEPQKHFEVSFVDGSVETVMGELPPCITHPLYVTTRNEGGIREVESVPEKTWWRCTLLAASPDQAKLRPYGRVHINLSNVTFIKEC